MAEQTGEVQVRPTTVIEPENTIFDTQRKALKVAILSDAPVTFTFNEVVTTYTPEQAKEFLTPADQQKTIDRLTQERDTIMSDAQKRLDQAKASLSEEEDFAKKAFPNEFPPEETPVQK